MIFNWGGRKQSRDESRIESRVRTDDELLDSFKSESWDRLTRADQISVLQEMENRRASIQGRSPCKIVEINSNNLYGSYNDGTNRININFEDFSSYDVLDTYIHESNHAYQHHCISQNCDYDYTTRSMLQAELAKDGYGNHYNYATQSPFYDLQYNEMDSNNVAADFLISQYTRYGKDPGYANYIEERASHFSGVNADLDALHSERSSLQHNQAYTSFVRCDINGDQFEAIENRINYSKTNDPMETRSKSIENQLQSLCASLRKDSVQEESYLSYPATNPTPNMYQNNTVTQQTFSDTAFEERGHQKGGSVVDTKESLGQRYREGIESLQAAYPNYQTDSVESATYAHEVQSMQEEMGINHSSPQYAYGYEPGVNDPAQSNRSVSSGNAISRLNRRKEAEGKTIHDNAISQTSGHAGQMSSSDLSKNAITKISRPQNNTELSHSKATDTNINHSQPSNEKTI